VHERRMLGRLCGQWLISSEHVCDVFPIVYVWPQNIYFIEYVVITLLLYKFLNPKPFRQNRQIIHR
jgi:hypothetical protein